jgi:hypothetical protein
VDDAGAAAVGEDSPEAFGPAVRLLGLNASQTSLDTVDVQMQWEAAEDVPQNYALALRLRDEAGGEWAALDTQPGYGFYPTGQWRPGEIVPLRLPLNIPVGTPPGEYALAVTLYETGSLAPIGQATRPVSLPIAAPAPDDVGRRLTPRLALAGVETPARLTQGEPLNLRAHWVTLQPLPAGLNARWSFAAEAGGEVVEADAPLAGASRPENWPADSLIQGRASLALPPDLAPGAYHLGLTLLDENGEAAATANSLAVVEVLERDRLAAPPPGARRLSAQFGEALGLAAYDLEQDAQALTLTPYWVARARPEASYKYFVHLFDPESEAILAQADGIPQGGAYPTTQWAAGEVVPDSVRLSLDAVSPGAYRLALGWYDPENPQDRLRAEDADGQPLEHDRLVLPEEITVR